MKKTEYKVMTSYSLNASASIWKRVYTDESGARYIKVKDGYKCIENMPCIDYITRD